MSWRAVENRKRMKSLILGIIKSAGSDGISVRNIIGQANGSTTNVNSEMKARDGIIRNQETTIASPNLVISLLDELYDAGMVDRSKVSKGRGPPRKVYHVNVATTPDGRLKDEMMQLIESDRLSQYFCKEISPQLWKRLVVLLGKFVSIGETPASQIAEQSYGVSKKYWNEFREEVMKSAMRSFFQFIATLSIFQTAETRKGRKVAIRSYYDLFSGDFGQECEDAFRTAVEAILVNFFPQEVSSSWSEIDRKIIKDVLREGGKLGSYDLNEEVKERRTKWLLEQSGVREK